MQQQLTLDNESLEKYISGLIGRFFKIIPMKEDAQPSLPMYLQSLQRELLGAQSLVITFQHDDRYTQLITTLQYLIDHEDVEMHVIRTEVFRAISNIKKLQQKYLCVKG